MTKMHINAGPIGQIVTLRGLPEVWHCDKAYQLALEGAADLMARGFMVPPDRFDWDSLAMAAYVDDASNVRQCVGVLCYNVTMNGTAYHADFIYVRPDYRRYKLANTLLRQMINAAKEQDGIVMVSLGIHHRNMAAQNLVTRNGFEATYQNYRLMLPE